MLSEKMDQIFQPKDLEFEDLVYDQVEKFLLEFEGDLHTLDLNPKEELFLKFDLLAMEVVEERLDREVFAKIDEFLEEDSDIEIQIQKLSYVLAEFGMWSPYFVRKIAFCVDQWLVNPDDLPTFFLSRRLLSLSEEMKKTYQLISAL